MKFGNREQEEKGGIVGIETHNSHMFEVVLQTRLLRSDSNMSTMNNQIMIIDH